MRMKLLDVDFAIMQCTVFTEYVQLLLDVEV